MKRVLATKGKREPDMLRARAVATVLSFLGAAASQCERGKKNFVNPAPSSATQGIPAAPSILPEAPAPAPGGGGTRAEGSGCEPLAKSPQVERKRVPNGKYGGKTESAVVSSADSVVDREINAAISSDLASRRAQFTKDADETLAETKGDPNGVKPAQMAQETECGEAVATPSVVSIECRSSTNLGGAHPEELRFAYTYRVCAGKSPTPVTLAVVCRAEAPCTKMVLAKLNGKLASGPAKDADVKLDEHSSVLKNFAVTKSGLRFFANEDLPHALQSAGTIDVPFGELRSVLRADGPLAELLR